MVNSQLASGDISFKFHTFSGNRIDSECLRILIDPLLSNKKLKNLSLGGKSFFLIF